MHKYTDTLYKTKLYGTTPDSYDFRMSKAKYQRILKEVNGAWGINLYQFADGVQYVFDSLFGEEVEFNANVNPSAGGEEIGVSFRFPDYPEVWFQALLKPIARTLDAEAMKLDKLLNGASS